MITDIKIDNDDPKYIDHKLIPAVNERINEVSAKNTVAIEIPNKTIIKNLINPGLALNPAWEYKIHAAATIPSVIIKAPPAIANPSSGNASSNKSHITPIVIPSQITYGIDKDLAVCGLKVIINWKTCYKLLTKAAGYVKLAPAIWFSKLNCGLCLRESVKAFGVERASR